MSHSHRRRLCTQIAAAAASKPNPTRSSNPYPIKQVIRSNFSETLDSISSQIADSDYVAVSLHTTGSYSTPWEKVRDFDTSDVRYLKAKRAAERFGVVGFGVCPFGLKGGGSKVVAYPYNFHLFPRDELRNGMPTYSFSCQTSYLTSMARAGFDFNTCIYDGISYLSRAQESVAKHHMGNPILAFKAVESAPAASVADQVFTERTKSRVRTWRDYCKKSAQTIDDPLVSCLRNLSFKGEKYGSRPCVDIDVCSERQVQLVVEVLKEFSDELVPLLVPGKRGESQAVRIIWTSSKEDKSWFENEVQEKEEAEAKRIRGFREVIDLISASQKPVIAHKSLDVFTFIHSKFLGPLPSSMDEFQDSLKSVFPCVLDINHLMKEVCPARRLSNLPAALSYLRSRFFAPVDIEIPPQGEDNGVKIHGQDTVKIAQLFAKLCSMLKSKHDMPQVNDENQGLALRDYVNTFSYCSSSSEEQLYEEVSISSINNSIRLRCEDLVFLWGFRPGTSAQELKALLGKTNHDLFSQKFDVRLVDRSCGVMFWQPGSSSSFLHEMSSGSVHCAVLTELICAGWKAASYNTYRDLCSISMWGLDLGDCLEKVVSSPDPLPESDREWRGLEIHWDDNTVTNLEDD
ncbi:Poly(A)-specific ribonuclease PARN-like-like protein [Drosera capensis]